MISGLVGRLRIEETFPVIRLVVAVKALTLFCGLHSVPGVDPQLRAGAIRPTGEPPSWSGAPTTLVMVRARAGPVSSSTAEQGAFGVLGVPSAEADGSQSPHRWQNIQTVLQSNRWLHHHNADRRDGRLPSSCPPAVGLSITRKLGLILPHPPPPCSTWPQ